MPPRAGALLVGQSGGGTAVINATLAGVVARARELGVQRVAGMWNGVEGLLADSLVDLSCLSDETLSLLPSTPSGALGLCRYRLREGDAERAVAILRRRDVRWLVYIGGNDSAQTAELIQRQADREGYELAVVSAPKTIDNDLPETDHTPGYGTAARFLAQAARYVGLDAWAMRGVDQVRLLEVYGRDAGWLAAATALARERATDPPHVLLLPERAFDEEQFLAAVEATVRREGFAVVVAAEMLRDRAGGLVGTDRIGRDDAFGHAESRRPGAVLQALVESRLGLRAKYDRPGSLQKVTAWSASTVDTREAIDVGRAAVDTALCGRGGVMVTLVRDCSAGGYRCTTGLAPLAKVTGAVRSMPDSMLKPAGLDVTPSFVHYARPLIGAPLPRVARLTDLLDRA